MEPEEEEVEQGARGGASMLPIVFSIVAGLLVVGLMGAIMFSPHNGGSGQLANNAPAAGAPQSAPPTPAGNPQQEKLAIGYLAPDFTANGVSGGGVQLASFRGKQPVWVNIWATWCGPCKSEMPDMQKLYSVYKSQGLEILGVDFQESKPTVQSYITANGFTWTFVNDFDGSIGQKYQAYAIPTHVFVGRDGVIKNIHIGAGWKPTEMEDDVKSLLTP